MQQPPFRSMLIKYNALGPLDQFMKWTQVTFREAPAYNIGAVASELCSKTFISLKRYSFSRSGYFLCNYDSTRGVREVTFYEHLNEFAFASRA